MSKIKKGDTVRIMAGKDKTKEGKVLRVFPALNKALVEGLNYVKKHKRRTKEGEQHKGIVEMENPISLANLKLVCKNCARPVRAGFKILKDKTKARVCLKCGESI